MSVYTYGASLVFITNIFFIVLVYIMIWSPYRTEKLKDKAKDILKRKYNWDDPRYWQYSKEYSIKELKEIINKEHGK